MDEFVNVDILEKSANSPNCNGDCCNNIALYINNKLLTWEKFRKTQDIHKAGVVKYLVEGDYPDRFKCTKQDTETKLCTIYETRPDTCRMYPIEMRDSNGKRTNTCPSCGFVAAP